ncbi:MAG TPA: YihY family inner membrane protein [Stellaceae bacterium]|jgi:membrane protein|nr:YihY family inner membrane protein [Stellaceae bacterium]
MPPLSALRNRLAILRDFAFYTVRRFVGDGCLTGAGALSYTTLVALVPLTAIALTVLSAVPAFAGIRDQLLATIFRTFVPQVGAEVEYWFRNFAGTLVRTTSIGMAALAVTVVLLLATIEDQLHRIWRVELRRPWLQRIPAYWAVLTLGPLLLGVSFSLPTYIDLVARHAGLGLDAAHLSRSHDLHELLRLVPFGLETLAFTLLYALIPDCTVRWREALLGALVAAVLVELLKVAFALYIGYVAAYRAVYGALAVIPIFLLWMYIVWGAVLFGAVVAAAQPQWRVDQKGAAVPSSARRLGLGLALLAELAAQTRQGGTLSIGALAERLGAATAAIEDELSLLLKAGFVAQAADGGWVLARALDGASLIDLYRALELPLALTLTEDPAFPWQTRIAPALARIADAETGAFAVPLSELIGVGAPVAPFPQRHRRA